LNAEEIAEAVDVGRATVFRYIVSGGANTVYFWRLQNHLP
jgi:hypothetical protein